MQYTKNLLRGLRRSIGQNIYVARLKQQMPLKKLARLFGLSEEKLDQYELGKNQITLEDLLRVACAIGTNPLELLDV